MADTAVANSVMNEEFDGLDVLHVLTLEHSPLNAITGTLLSLLVRRCAAVAEDTFDGVAKLIGVQVSYT